MPDEHSAAFAIHHARRIAPGGALQLTRHSHDSPLCSRVRSRALDAIFLSLAALPALQPPRLALGGAAVPPAAQRRRRNPRLLPLAVAPWRNVFLPRSPASGPPRRRRARLQRRAHALRRLASRRAMAPPARAKPGGPSGAWTSTWPKTQRRRRAGRPRRTPPRAGRGRRARRPRARAATRRAATRLTRRATPTSRASPLTCPAARAGPRAAPPRAAACTARAWCGASMTKTAPRWTWCTRSSASRTSSRAPPPPTRRSRSRARWRTRRTTRVATSRSSTWCKPRRVRAPRAAPERCGPPLSVAVAVR